LSGVTTSAAMWLAGNSVASATRLPFFHQARVRFGTTYLYAT
jgi:hypothetical protein